MIPGIRRPTAKAATTALLITLAPLTACTNTPRAKPTPVSLTQATKVLATDGHKIANSFNLSPGAIDDRTDVDDPEGCPPGTARRRFTVTKRSAASPDVRKDVASASAAADTAVKNQGYARAGYKEGKDERGNPTFYSSWRKASAAVNVTTTAWRQTEPEQSVVFVSGVTDCLK